MFDCALLAEAYVHDLDPFAIRLGTGFGLRWYGLAYLAGMLIGWGIVRWFARTGRVAMTVDQVTDMMFLGFMGVVLGGRLGYVLFYDPALLGFTADVPWWGVLQVNRGGMSSHGGMLGVIVAMILFCRRHRLDALAVLDVAALACTPGLMLGRIANFVNAELWGKVVPVAAGEPAPWWSVKYPRELTSLDPQRLVAAADAAVAAGIDRASWLAAAGDVAVSPEARGAALAGIARIEAAVHAGNAAVIEALRPALTAYWPSQLLQALTDGPILFAAMAVVWLRPRRPGVVGGTFGIAYGALRILTEVVRQPDPGVALLLGLSRGQVLSVALIAAGAAVIGWSRRRDVPRHGGLLRRPVVSPDGP